MPAKVDHASTTAEGKILDVGRRTRTIPTPIRRALTARDKGCQFPGCGLKFCEAHHLKHWAEGGETSLDNLVLLCRRHHRAVHEEGYRIEGKLRMVSCASSDHKGGRFLPFLLHRPRSRNPLAEISRALLDEEDISIDAQTGFPRWQGERLDLNWAIQGYRQM